MIPINTDLMTCSRNDFVKYIQSIADEMITDSSIMNIFRAYDNHIYKNHGTVQTIEECINSSSNYHFVMLKVLVMNRKLFLDPQKFIKNCKNGSHKVYDFFGSIRRSIGLGKSDEELIEHIMYMLTHARGITSEYVFNSLPYFKKKLITILYLNEEFLKVIYISEGSCFNGFGQFRTITSKCSDIIDNLNQFKLIIDPQLVQPSEAITIVEDIDYTSESSTEYTPDTEPFSELLSESIELKSYVSSTTSILNKIQEEQLKLIMTDIDSKMKKDPTMVKSVAIKYIDRKKIMGLHDAIIEQMKDKYPTYQVNANFDNNQLSFVFVC